MELHAGSEMEGVGAAVLAQLPSAGEDRDKLVLRVERQEPLVDVLEQVACLALGHLRGVQRGGLDGERVAKRGFRALSAPVAAGERATGSGRKKRATRKQPAHG